jgi:polyphenol oxidase
MSAMNILRSSSMKIKEGIPYFENSEMARVGWICHGFLTRKGGISPAPYDSLNISLKNGDRETHFYRNRERVARAFGFNPDHLVLLDQIHRDRILLLKESPITFPSPLEYDAVITDLPETLLGIRTADCLPIFVADPGKRIIAAIHAGRQGTALEITAKVLKRMVRDLGCSVDHLLVTLGPSIGSCCYEIGPEVFEPSWEPFSVRTEDGKRKIDLARINIAQMEKEGIDPDRISWIDLCVCCHRDLFYSYRREGKTGRQLSFIGML